jgi:hypothetical protein
MEDGTVSVLEMVAAALLVLGNFLVIRAVIAADQALPSAEPSQTEQEAPRPAPPLRRAA